MESNIFNNNEFIFKTESIVDTNSEQTPNNKINRFKINKPNVHFSRPNENYISSDSNQINFNNQDIFEYIGSNQFKYEFGSDMNNHEEQINTTEYSNSNSNSNSKSDSKSDESSDKSLDESDESDESLDQNETSTNSEDKLTENTQDIAQVLNFSSIDNINSISNNADISESGSESELDNSDSFEGLDDLEPLLEKKYFDKNLTRTRYHDEIKTLKLQYKSKIDLMILENNYQEITNLLEQGETIYQNKNDQIIRLCGNKDHIVLNGKNCCNQDCNKTLLFRALKNTNRGIKTMYYLLLKLLISQPNLRNLCKCCEENISREYLQNLEKNFVERKSNIIEDIRTKLDPKRMIELQINYLINKFMGVIGLLPCECKFTNRLYSFYQDNYLNFKETIKIYTRTIPHVIKILKIYYNIKDNHEELSLIKDSRCIHEDIRFNNLTYCLRKDYSSPSNKIINEIVMKIDILNIWILDSIKIGIHLYNQQSLEYFRYILGNLQKSDKQINLSEYFNKMYSINNELLDLNYTSNKKNIITSIVEYYDNKIEPNLTLLVSTIKSQLEIRNNKFSDRYDINDIFIYYVIESFKNNLINIGLEFLKNIKNLKYKKEIEPKIQYIFNILLSNDEISIKTKISYLKIINKNKINVIEYDILNKLIDIKLGDKIILEFNKNENSLFNINDYKNAEYILTIIKRCIGNNKVNILDYVLYNLDSNIKSFNINPLIIYLIHIPKRTIGLPYIDKEYEYIGLLQTIVKYNYKMDIEIQDDKIDNSIGLLEYCINYELTHSAKILIENKIKLEAKILIKCIENLSHIILGYILKANPNLLQTLFSDLTLINYFFQYIENKNIHNDIIMRFILKIINPILKYRSDNLVYLVNYQDENNELFGMKILNSKLENKNKIIIFSLLKDLIDPLKVNIYKKGSINTCNFPIILHSMLLNQVEITYIFLNNLFKNKIIKKINTNLNNTIFDYYHTNKDIELNFVPLILKFIQDNYKNNFNDDLYTNKNVILESDANAIELVLFTIGLSLYFCKNLLNKEEQILNYDNKILNEKIEKSQIKKTEKNRVLNKIKNRLIKEPNGYLEITVDSNVNNVLETDTIINENKKDLKRNKNIWISSTKNSETLNRRYSTDSSRSSKSSISESEIFFN